MSKKRKTKFTPGPWRVSDAYVMKGNGTLASCLAMCEVEGDISKEEEYANAQLMSLAPEMHDLLRSIIDQIVGSEAIDSKTFHKACAVLAKVMQDAP